MGRSANGDILVITPANLRKQWHQEIQEKFFLPCVILESRSYNQAIKAGNLRPFEIGDAIVICSYQFARTKAADVNAVRWELVVIDEAHRLRNVYKPSNVIANTLKHGARETFPNCCSRPRRCKTRCWNCSASSASSMSRRSAI